MREPLDISCFATELPNARERSVSIQCSGGRFITQLPAVELCVATVRKSSAAENGVGSTYLMERELPTGRSRDQSIGALKTSGATFSPVFSLMTSASVRR